MSAAQTCLQIALRVFSVQNQTFLLRCVAHLSTFCYKVLLNPELYCFFRRFSLVVNALKFVPQVPLINIWLAQVTFVSKPRGNNKHRKTYLPSLSCHEKHLVNKTNQLKFTASAFSLVSSSFSKACRPEEMWLWIFLFTHSWRQNDKNVFTCL